MAAYGSRPSRVDWRYGYRCRAGKALHAAGHDSSPLGVVAVLHTWRLANRWRPQEPPAPPARRPRPRVGRRYPSPRRPLANGERSKLPR
jgi:hypothetical protein